MANEDKKDFNSMLHDNKDMPKIQVITDQKSIEKYGGNKMYFAPPIDYDKVMKKVPYGKVITVGTIREYFAELSGADFTEPITAGIFVSIVAWASYQRSEDETPYFDAVCKQHTLLLIQIFVEYTVYYGAAQGHVQKRLGVAGRSVRRIFVLGRQRAGHAQVCFGADRQGNDLDRVLQPKPRPQRQLQREPADKRTRTAQAG